ncbi:TVP38/TMEM64 family protein [Halobacillus salinarum]|uniref:TVP38/TMEM64 family membrane protein n=1 Tax=Halobacillus salinarum TaxID=2932257 RepID=A0ABY4EGW1_9BACI|nr:TVP38/TMEM64 family protein [Halobacillus salinarum]UOQ43687.1 TVP38/TMEM64 family protein [Halobacillus salinarum]
MNSSQLKSFIIKILILLSAAGLIVLINQLFIHIKPKTVADWMKQLHGWAPFVFMLIFILRPFTLIPLSIVAVACGLVFGPYLGAVYIVIGTTLGGIVSFSALKYASKSVELSNCRNLSQLKKELEKNGLKAVMMLRLIPAVNFDLLTYICAKTEVQDWKYTLGTLVGTIPGSLMLGLFGSSMLTLKPGNLLILSVILVTIAALGIKMKKNIEDNYDTEKLKEEVKELRSSA